MSTLSGSRWDAIILGAGISGLVSASLLHRQGLKKILVIDEYGHLGGNHIDRHIGPYTFDIGTLIFQDDSPLMRHFPELLPIYHPVKIDISRVAPDGGIRRYPFSLRDDLLAAGPLEWVRLLGSLAWARLPPARIANAEDYARYWLGQRFFERSGLAQYIERFYGAPAAEIDRVFAEKRMPNIADAASLRKRIARLLGAKKGWDTKQEFVRPRGGFQLLYESARQSLTRLGTRFALGERLRSLSRDGSAFRVRTERLDAVSDCLLATIPLNRTIELCGLSRVADLPSVELVSLFFSFQGGRGFSSNVLYNFGDSGRWKRVTMASDFYGLAQGREYFTVEINHVPNGMVLQTHELIYGLTADFRADTASKGLFQGDLVLEGSHVLRNAYPIYRNGVMAAAEAAIDSLRDFGIRSYGRQGGFDYLPTARHVTLTVEEKLRPAPGVHVR